MGASGLLNTTTEVVVCTVAATGAMTVVSVNGATPPSANYFSLRLAEAYYAELIVTASAGTVDVALQHSTDGGVTFRTLPLKFAQSAAASATTSYALAFKPAIGLSDAAFAPTIALTGAAQAVNIPFQTKYLRAYATLGTAGATTITLAFTMQPKGNVAQ